MVKRNLILTFLMLAINLGATTLISQNTYKFQDRIEVALVFDNEFDGEIFLTKNEDNFNIFLRNVKSKEKFLSNVNSKIISSFTIENVKDGVELVVVGDKNLELDAELSKDNKTLNIKFIDKNLANSINEISKKEIVTQKETTKNSSNFKITYIIIPFILIVTLVFLYFKFKKLPSENLDFKGFDDFEDSAFKNLDDNIQEKNEEVIVEEKHSEELDKENLDVNLRPNVIYNNKITNDRELLLIEKDGKIYISFLTKDNELPEKSYNEMLEHEDKFQEFLEICKNKTI
ncbi:putative membrane protein [Campylobacter blaseri]|uniref:Excinuclease ABC subunit A n=1 Tax=Campylobacter blaseri TaxID=2042961 RepID=A0A2P8QZE6_9BACT|nr:hypothetical protein [Campylobacter blaseri]PSM51628.1 hypothetical protein CQ405_07485 [Campylobacter blaseri]PSM53421.1 hypothetical protein CRN67_07490 [Campylobacter blaseri]QKF86717.1 putative membrane protein [Campylobacter blaseri]